MVETSKDGIQILRALALAVRSEQDFDLAPKPTEIVGALKRAGALPSDASQVKQERGYAEMLKIDGYSPLSLREALNKIAHADPQSADYYVAPMDTSHDLLLYGTNRGQAWFAAVSIIELVKAVRSLPDATIVSPSTK